VNNVRAERANCTNVRTKAAPIVTGLRLGHDSGLSVRAATRNPIDDLAADTENGHVDPRIESRDEVGKA
jgi:hypothetical protein